MRTFCRTLFALGTMSAALSAQAGVSHAYDSTQTINSNAYVYASDIATDADGNVFIVGRFKSGSVGGTYYDGTTDFDPGAGSDDRTPLQSNYSGDAYLTKINADGSYAWTAAFGYATGSAFADGVAVDSTGNVYLTGSYIGTMDFDPGPGAVLHTASSSYKRFVVKLHNDGSYAWMLDGLAESQGSGIHRTRIKIDGNDDIYLTGTSAAGSFDFDFTAGVDAISVTGGTAAYVSKYHSDGSYGWTRVYTAQDPGDYVHITDLAFDGSGNLLVLGDFNGASANPAVDVDPGTGTELVSQTMNICQVHNFIASLLPASGDFGGWVIPLPRSYNSFVLDSQGNIYLTGISKDGAYDPFICQTSNQLGDYQVGGNYSAVLTKLIGHTGYGWTTRFVSVPNSSYPRGIGEKVVADSADGIYVVGGSEYTGINASPDPLYVARFNSGGEMSWVKSYGIGDSYRAAIDKDNNIYTAGKFGLSADFDPGPGTDTKTPTGNVSVYLTKFEYDAANTAPEAFPDTFSIDQDTTLYGTLSASDAENDPLSYSIVAKGNLGTPTITDAATGAFTYTPIPGDSGTDSFTYIANDGQLNSNVATITVSIVPASPGADLLMTKLSAPAGAEPGKYITVSSTVKNAGGSPAGPFKVGLYLSADSTITTGDIYLGYRSVTSLASDASSAASSTIRIPPSLARGEYYLGAIADYQHTIKESDESNNTIEMPFEVTAPDLVISAFNGPGSAAQATYVTVSGTVTNNGKAASPLFYVGLYLSTDSDITTGDTSLGYALIGGLTANTSTSFSKSVKIPAGLAVGKYYLGAIADYSDRVTESDETNNSRSEKLDIIIPVPDLTVTSVSGSPDIVASQGALNLNGTVENNGTGTPGTATYAGFYLAGAFNDIFLKRVRIPATLAPGASINLSTIAQLPASVAEGNYTVKLVADYMSTLAESDETNNDLPGNSITVTAPAAGTGSGSQSNLPQTNAAGTSSQSNQTGTVPSTAAGSGPTSNDGSSSASGSPPSTGGGGGATEINTLMLLGVLVMARRSRRERERYKKPLS